MQNTIFFHSKEKSNSRAKETTLHQKIENIDEVVLVSILFDLELQINFVSLFPYLDRSAENSWWH